MPSKKRKYKVDLVIPVYNEAGVVEKIHAQIRAAVDNLPHDFRFLYVDDGSDDGTAESLHSVRQADRRVTVLTLSTNFGHQAALSAGIDHSTGDIVISMDGDGQHPPEMIIQMIDLIGQGYDIVQAQRVTEARASFFKKWTSDIFYKFLNTISGTQLVSGAADFRALNRQAVDALKAMPEYHRFLRGMISWMGYRSAILPYHQPARMAGRSKYSLGKMFRLASDAIFSFSLIPLYIGLSSGLVFFALAAAQLSWVLWLSFSGNTQHVIAPGWSSLMAVLLIASGIIMILLGFIGVYVGYIFQQVKQRPVYLLKKGE
ncbi:MAG: putative glycosyltransferase [Anaerolineales bacterium]|nr:putative glycosyltransferase [Anaerolineales bacterium]WKZ47592.1 MAG: glycosyltransferase family 2 protein [Anaerolineales bacterium]